LVGRFEALEAAGYRTTGLDVSRKMLDQLDHPKRQLVEADLSQELPNGVPTYDCVLALDVIEHLDGTVTPCSNSDGC
jgi:2-polyprenyl-3-methyl-5-hydroxy-6-metoxy-1,4-benzoquinol methylase